ncbi:MAG: inositol monophosphatase family protein [Gemmatimonadales bacterium]
MVWNLGPEDRELLEAAREAADKAGRVHRARAGGAGSLTWEEKGTSDFVTEVDREAERAIVETLLARFPDHEILAEEEATGASAPARPAQDTAPGSPAAEIRWVVDPLDGTTNWLHGFPEYAVSIAAVDSAGLRLGLVLNSARGELFEAVRGAGARSGDQPIQVSELSELRLALVGTGFPFKGLHVLRRYTEMFSRVLTSTSGIRRAGSAALDLCNVACGRFDAFWELALMPWDFAAGILIIREAGGLVERLRVPGYSESLGVNPGADCGEPLWPGGLVAANPRLFPAFRELIISEE